jgi:hypothetical protein
MRDVDCDVGEEYEVLIQDNDFRIIKDPGDASGSMIQHHCDNPLKSDDMYCDLPRGWHYCWAGDRECTGCAAPVPSRVLGFLKLMAWER